jgi:ribonuclease HI
MRGKGDCVFHRTYRCKGTERLVRQAVPEWFWKEAQAVNERDGFWVSAAMPHPADLVPPPRTDYQSWVLDAEGNRCEDPYMQDHVFIDGSCTTSVFRGLQRAALALVQLGDDSKAVKTVSVPLWGSLPQTSQAAEFAAYAGLSHVLGDQAVAYGDCQGVLSQAEKPPADRYSGRRKYSGVLRSMLKYPQGLARITRAVKVRAHQCIDGITDPQERWRAVGNDLADAAAKAAVERHPKPPPGARRPDPLLGETCPAHCEGCCDGHDSILAVGREAQEEARHQPTRDG